MTAIQEIASNAKMGYASKMKKLVCPVRANLHSIELVSNKILFEVNRREFLIVLSTG